MEKTRLENICVFIRNGASIKNDKTKNGIPITRIETISKGIIDENSMGYADIWDDKYKEYYLKQEDILMSHINSSKHLGKVAICDIDKKIIHGMNLLNIRLKETVCSKYVYYFFKTTNFKKQLNKISKQSVNQSSFSVNDLKKIFINLPELQKQKKVAYKLDRIQEVIDIRNRQIEELDGLIKSQFVEMFGDVKTNDRKWNTKTGNEIFIFGSGKSNVTSNLSGEFEYKCYGGNGITGYSRDYLIDYATIVIGRVGAYCGSIYKTEGKVWITDNAIYIREFKECNNIKFLEEMFRRIDFHRFANFSGQPKITQKPLQNYNYILPPIELQNQFAKFVEQIDKQKFKIQKSLDQMKMLQESLMDKFFAVENNYVKKC